MNSFQRSLIEKAGYDNGWECAKTDADGYVELASALHGAGVRIGMCATGEVELEFRSPELLEELLRSGGAWVKREQMIVVDEPTLPDVLRLAARLARALPDRPLRKYREACELELGRGEYTLESFSTEAEAIVRRRVGQQIYRASLMDYWDGRCAVTGIALPELLRASHSKDWAHCASDAERLNVFNGFLLAAHLDALYDRKLMTFDDAGNALYSPRIDPHTRAQLRLNEPLRLSKIDPRHLPFLHWHRFVFENAPEA